MAKIEIIVFNPFQVNTYLLYDDSGECLIVDPGCYDAGEQDFLAETLEKKGLKPVLLVNTHCHVDHVMGNNFVHQMYGLRPVIHQAGLVFLQAAREQARVYGFSLPEPVLPGSYTGDGELISFGNSALRVAYTPGHADGSICLISEEDQFVISGDVLFRESIGRTDFPTGNFGILMDSIRNKLFTLDDDFTVYPGHGPETSIGHEKSKNPFTNNGQTI